MKSKMNLFLVGLLFTASIFSTGKSGPTKRKIDETVDFWYEGPFSFAKGNNLFFITQEEADSFIEFAVRGSKRPNLKLKLKKYKRLANCQFNHKKCRLGAAQDNLKNVRIRIKRLESNPKRTKALKRGLKFERSKKAFYKQLVAFLAKKEAKRCVESLVKGVACIEK